MNSAPPLSPQAWKVASQPVFTVKQAWGNRVLPYGVFQIPNGIGILYNSAKIDQEYIPPYNSTRTQTGSLAFSRNLVDWHDYPDNPVLYEVQQPWQGRMRVMPRAWLYDPRNEQWVAYIVDSHGHYPGIRGVGAAYSGNLVDWRMEEQPTITIDEVIRARTGRDRSTVEEQDGGCAYPDWAIYNNGRYYLSVYWLDTKTGDSGRILFSSDEPGRNFTPVRDADGNLVEGDFLSPSRPVYADGKWYALVRSGGWDGGRIELGLAWSENLLGPYERNPQNPIISMDAAASTAWGPSLLFRHDGTWAVLAGIQYENLDAPGEIRLALANLDPDLIPREPAVEKPAFDTAPMTLAETCEKTRQADIRKITGHDLLDLEIGVKRIENGFAIDGDPEKYRDRPYMLLKASDGSELTAGIHTGWDNEHFYLAVAVTDKKHFNTRSEGGIWDGDCLQFVIAPHLDKTAENYFEPFNLALALASDQTQAFQYTGPDTGLWEQAEYTVVRHDHQNLTFYELKIPFSCLRMTPEEGTEFAFGAVIYDDDDGAGFNRWIETGPGIAGGFNPLAFRTFILVE